MFSQKCNARFRGWKYNCTSKPNPSCGEYVLRKSNPSEPVVSANAVPSARNTRNKTSDKAPGARAAKHSKAVVEEPVTTPSVAALVVATPAAAKPAVAMPVVAATPVVAPVSAPVAVTAPVVVEPVAVATPVAAPAVKTVTQEEIAKLAYCYWADRDYQGGSPDEDWARAEQTLRSMAAAS
jgi:hypothetical protein